MNREERLEKAIKNSKAKLLHTGKLIQDIIAEFDGALLPDSIKDRLTVADIQDLYHNNHEGFTVDINGNHYVGEGFAVGLTDNYGTHIMGAFANIIQAFDYENKRSQSPVYIGGWEDNNKFYLDVVVIIPDLATAVYVAKQKRQKAIYSFVEHRTIYLSDLDLD